MLAQKFVAAALFVATGALAAEVIDSTDSTIVKLTIGHSRTIENAARQRAADRQDLNVAVDKFRPDVILTGLLSWAGQSSTPRDGDRSSSQQRGYGTDLRLVQKLTTGTEWSVAALANGTDGDDPSASLGLAVTALQPLLRGRGQAVNRASVEIARLVDDSSRLVYEQSVIDTVTAALLSYRNVIQAARRQDIARRSVDSAQRRLENNRQLVKSGRLAESELVQNETEIASREVDVSIAANALDSARLRLLDVLDLDRDVELAPKGDLAMPTRTQDLAQLTVVALDLRSDYGRAKNALAIARLRDVLTRDDVRWDVDLVANYTTQIADLNRFQPFVGAAATSSDDWRLELELQRLFGDRTRAQRVIQSQANLAIVANQVEDLAQTIRLQVQDGVRDVDLRVRQVALARTALALAERQLNIEEQKLGFGRTSSFNVIRFQEDLIAARERELFAAIEAVNAGTRLDQILGTTLKRWQIEIGADAWSRTDTDPSSGRSQERYVGPGEQP